MKKKEGEEEGGKELGQEEEEQEEEEQKEEIGMVWHRKTEGHPCLGKQEEMII